jgi:hypothetical protein
MAGKWQPPQDYAPMPNLGAYLDSLSPKMGTPEMDMMMYWQWVHRSLAPFRRTPAEAWRDLRMTVKNAQGAIDGKIVPMEIYPQALERATSSMAALKTSFARRRLPDKTKARVKRKRKGGRARRF